MSYDLGTAHGKITLSYDGDKEIGKAERDIDKLEKKAATSNKSVVKLGKTLSVLGKGLKLAGLATIFSQAAISAGALAIQVAGIIPSLVSILSLGAALPGIFVGALATVGVLKAAFAGVGDALKAAFDPKGAAKFKEALAELSPEAAKFVTALHDAAPALKDFQKGIQEAFFRASFLTGQVPRLVKALADLRPTILTLAADFGELTRKLANFALSGDSLSFINDAIGAFDAAVVSAGRGMIPMLKGLRDVGEVGLPLLLRLGDAAGDVGIKFGEWLTEVSNDGRLQAWIDTALSTLKTLGDIVGNVGSILNSVLGAASETGGGLLNTIAEITGQFAEFLKSAEGSEAIRSLFSGILALAKGLSPILTTLAGILASALGPAIEEIATTFGPVLLDVIERLAPAFAPLVGALVNLMTAIAPLLPPIAELVGLLAGVLATAINTVVSEFGPLISIIADALTQAFEDFGPVVEEMAKGLPVAAKAGVELAAAFAPLIPVILDLAKVLADSLIDVMPQLVSAAEELIPVFVDLAAVFAGQLADGLKRITPLIPILVKAFAVILPILANVATFGFRIATAFLNLIGAIKGLLSTLGQLAVALYDKIVSALTTAYGAVQTAGKAIIDWFVALPGRILDGIKALPGLLVSFLNTMLQQSASAIGFGIGIIVGIFTKLIPNIISTIQGLPVVLARIFIAAGTAMYQAILTAGTNVYNFIKNLPNRIRSALSALGSILSNVFKAALSAAKTAVSNGATAIYNFFHGLPARIRSGLGNLGNLLKGSGESIVNGLYNGIKAAAGRVLDYVKGLADRVKSSFNNALSIFSPSRDFFDSGVNIGKGIILGLKDQLKGIAATAQLLANTTIQPTLALPAAAASAASALGLTQTGKPLPATEAETSGFFGPYQMELDGKVVAAFVVDTVTGNPKVVSKAANEGDRVSTWNGSGRKAM